MIFKWIAHILEKKRGTKTKNQILQQPKLIQRTEIIEPKKATRMKKERLKSGSILKKYQEDKTKFITLARKKSDSN